VQHLIAFCLNDACRHKALIDVSSYPAETEVPSFKNRVKCGKCGGKREDVGRNSRRCQPSSFRYVSLVLKALPES
jgi:hypothetical protein